VPGVRPALNRTFPLLDAEYHALAIDVAHLSWRTSARRKPAPYSVNSSVR
jgi:hypothetical protein